MAIMYDSIKLPHSHFALSGKDIIFTCRNVDNIEIKE
jgi:hypothetical protein